MIQTVSKIEPGQLWLVDKAVTVYPVDDGVFYWFQIPGNEIILTLCPTFIGKGYWYQILYDEKRWEMESAHFLNGSLVLCQ